MLDGNNLDPLVQIEVGHIVKLMTDVFESAGKLVPHLKFLEDLEKSTRENPGVEAATNPTIKKMLNNDPERIKIFNELSLNSAITVVSFIRAIKAIRIQNAEWMKEVQTPAVPMSKGEELFRSIINEGKIR